MNEEFAALRPFVLFDHGCNLVIVILLKSLLPKSLLNSYSEWKCISGSSRIQHGTFQPLLKHILEAYGLSANDHHKPYFAEIHLFKIVTIPRNTIWFPNDLFNANRASFD